MKWFETWFDSNYYHQLYQHRNDEEAEFFISNLIKFLDLPKGDKVLDLACGKGRHSVYLNKLGYNVTGVDLSENSISLAQQHQNPGLSFMVKDMRNAFTSSEFKCIFNLFTSFGYFNSTDENLKVLRAIEQMLEPKGTFVIDFMNANKVIKNLVKEEVKSIDGINFQIHRFVKNEVIHKQIEFEDNGETHTYIEKVQALTLNDFEQLMEQTNLNIKHIFGDFSLSQFDLEASDRLIIIGEKE